MNVLIHVSCVIKLSASIVHRAIFLFVTYLGSGANDTIEHSFYREKLVHRGR